MTILFDKTESAIKSIKLGADISQRYYKKPLIIAYSGGKDSDVLVDLAIKSGANVEFLNSHTTVDAPETVYHIEKKFNELKRLGYGAKIIYPKDKNGQYINMWDLIIQKRMPPTRMVRYCCAVLKETQGKNRIVATGVRADESLKRSHRKAFELISPKVQNRVGISLDHMFDEYIKSQNNDEIYDCAIITQAKKNGKIIVNPLIDFTQDDIWTYILKNNIKVNPLYKKGYMRVGCVGCPLGGRKHMLKELSDYPKFKKLYILAFQKMIDKRRSDGMPTQWETGEDVFNWWVNNPEYYGQMKFEFDDEKYILDDITK